MDYQQTVDYLFTKLPMFSRIGADAFKKDLTNTLSLCAALDNPQQKFRSIHIAGTNGKGSVSHMLAASLQAAGYKTGLYTSPHLKDFRERIRVNGQLCDKSFVIDFTERIMPLIDEIEPSFFEITVAMAFDYFAQQKVDVAVIEVGLGGRLDSTNIIMPDLSIITNIGWDHMNLLGDTLDKIALEKAGIIKQNTPVVIGEATEQLRLIFDQVAASKKAPISYADEKRYVAGWRSDHHQLKVEIAEGQHDEHEKYTLDLAGIYQLKNLVTLLEAVHQLRMLGWKLPATVVKEALAHVKKQTGFHGRWETISEHPSVVLDVGHNPDGMAQIVRQLELTSYQHLHIIIGLVKDKEIDKVLALLPKHASYYFTQARIPRALDAHSLKLNAERAGLSGQIYDEVNTALKAAVSHAHKEDLVLVCGSVFLVGEVNL
ncbi:MAG: bifunctional folylpolyglutamate synthase/dihydrofolate synthase [Chitinophagaceae bacterium]|nr:bifunctional folylpolyglutamate synthase/dihydrofolate synthase [Chitinophagaceae bacterium]